MCVSMSSRETTDICAFERRNMLDVIFLSLLLRYVVMIPLTFLTHNLSEELRLMCTLIGFKTLAVIMHLNSLCPFQTEIQLHPHVPFFSLSFCLEG